MRTASRSNSARAVRCVPRIMGICASDVVVPPEHKDKPQDNALEQLQREELLKMKQRHEAERAAVQAGGTFVPRPHSAVAVGSLSQLQQPDPLTVTCLAGEVTQTSLTAKPDQTSSTQRSTARPERFKRSAPTPLHSTIGRTSICLCRYMRCM